ncbi:MAG: GNAT family N-acetyltransferase [Butyricicoccus sp.]|nr:GNAT family N-acetyltransferase [Butyricicoccus sp.]
MQIQFKKTLFADATELHRMQVICFQPLLEKYGDTDTNPAAESIECVQNRLLQSETDYYFICLHEQKIGAIRVVRLPENTCRISPMFILPEFQNKGLAQATLLGIEKLYPQAVCWQLDTIKEEAKLCHLYEKLRYRTTGQERYIQQNMTIVFYEKRTDF